VEQVTGQAIDDRIECLVRNRFLLAASTTQDQRRRVRRHLGEVAANELGFADSRNAADANDRGASDFTAECCAQACELAPPADEKGTVGSERNCIAIGGAP
jgi:hypothetical protein